MLQLLGIIQTPLQYNFILSHLFSRNSGLRRKSNTIGIFWARSLKLSKFVSRAFLDPLSSSFRKMEYNVNVYLKKEQNLLCMEQNSMKSIWRTILRFLNLLNQIEYHDRWKSWGTWHDVSRKLLWIFNKLLIMLCYLEKRGIRGEKSKKKKKAGEVSILFRGTKLWHHKFTKSFDWLNF